MNDYQFSVHFGNSNRPRRRATSNSVASQAGLTRSPYQDRTAHASSLQNDALEHNDAFEDNDLSVAAASKRPRVWLDLADREVLLRQQAIEKAHQGQSAEAIELFTLLIHYNPDSASNFNNRGLLYFQIGDYAQALADYDQALALNPRLAKVYNNRANCYAGLGDLEAAISDYETAIDLDPTDIRAYLNQGITFRELNLFEQAIEAFDLALQISQLLNSTDEAVRIPPALEGHIYAERGRTYHFLGDWNCAVADYHRALDRLPITDSFSGVSARLRQQVNQWLDSLLNPMN